MQTNREENPFFSEEFRQRWYRERTEGKAEGMVEGKAQSLLKMFRLRGWTATPEVEARVLACRDEAEVDLWTDRVLTVATLAEVFEP